MHLRDANRALFDGLMPVSHLALIRSG